MKVTGLETTIVNVPFGRTGPGNDRGGTTEVIVKLSADNGLVGWGESPGQLSSAAAIEATVRHIAPLVIGRDPWDREAIARSFFRRGTLYRWTQMANFAFAGIDHALWDLCGKDCGQPVHRLLGGAVRDTVDHCFHLFQGPPDEITRQCEDGHARGYRVFYLPCARHPPPVEAEMIEAIRETIGDEGKIRLDANEGWGVNEAIRNLNDWDSRWRIDFCEAPVAHDRPDGMREVRARVPCAISANECLASESDVLRLVRSRCADVYCFAPYLVGTLKRFIALAHLIDLEGLTVSKHTYGELGIGAAASHHAALCVPSLADGNQQSAAGFADDVLTEPLPIATGPTWGRIDKPGLGVEVDGEKLGRYHEAYLRDGQYLLPEYRPG